MIYYQMQKHEINLTNKKICITAGDKTLVKYKQEKTLLTTCFNKPANSLRHFLPDKRSSTTGKQDLNKTIATDAI